MIEGNAAEVGIGVLTAITLLKTVLPYVRPAKNGHVGKDVVEGLKPFHEREINLLEKMNERDIEVKLSVNAIHKRMDKDENN